MDHVEQPDYTISCSQKQDGSYVWNPPEGSPELEEALGHHFPRVKGLELRMLAARAELIKSKAVVARAARKGTANLPSFHTSVLDAKTMVETTEKRQKKAYGTSKNAEVFRNRNMTCGYHKQRKEKCDPKVCTDNKLYRAPQPDFMAMVLNGSDNRRSYEFNVADSLKSPKAWVPTGPHVPRTTPVALGGGDSTLENYKLTSGGEGEDSGYWANDGANGEGTFEDDPDDGNDDGNDGQNDRRDDNSDDYGDYWKAIDEDPNGTSGPFGGGTAPNGGGYPKSGGGYYSLKEKYRSCEGNSYYTYPSSKHTNTVQVGWTWDTLSEGQEAVDNIENSIGKLSLGLNFQDKEARNSVSER